MNPQDNQPAPPPVNPTPTPTQANQSNPIAIAGFVLSFFPGPLGLVFSAIGLKKAKQLGGSNQGLAVAGLVISILGTLVWIGFVLILIFLPPKVSVSALDSFEADNSPQAVEVVSYDFRDNTGADDLYRDLEEWNKLNQVFYYQPASPQTCSYHLDGSAVGRSLVASSVWRDYKQTLAMGGHFGTYILSRDCGQWQQVDNS